MFWSFILDQTMNRNFLSPLQRYIVLTDSTLTSFHLLKTLYHGPQGSSTFGKPLTSIAMNISQHSGQFFWIKTCPNMSCTSSEPTIMLTELQPNTFPPMTDALLQTTGKWNDSRPADIDANTKTRLRPILNQVQSQDFCSQALWGWEQSSWPPSP